MNHYGKLRHRKNVLESIRKYLSNDELIYSGFVGSEKIVFDRINASLIAEFSKFINQICAKSVS